MRWKDIFELKPLEQGLSVALAFGGAAVDKYLVKPNLERWKLFDKIDVVALGEAVAGFLAMCAGLAQMKKSLLVGLPLWTLGSALIVDGIEHLLGWNPYRIIAYQKLPVTVSPPAPAPAPPAPAKWFRFIV